MKTLTAINQGKVPPLPANHQKLVSHYIDSTMNHLDNLNQIEHFFGELLPSDHVVHLPGTNQLYVSFKMTNYFFELMDELLVDDVSKNFIAMMPAAFDFHYYYKMSYDTSGLLMWIFRSTEPEWKLEYLQTPALSLSCMMNIIEENKHQKRYG